MNCNGCKHLHYFTSEDESTELDGYYCEGIDYKDCTVEALHNNRLQSESYRLAHKRCAERADAQKGGAK